LSKGSFGRFSGACRIAYTAIALLRCSPPPSSVSSIVGHAAHNKDDCDDRSVRNKSCPLLCACVCLIPGHNKPNFPGCHLPVPRGQDRTPSPGAVVSSRITSRHPAASTRPRGGPLCVRRFLPSLQADRPTGNPERSTSAPVCMIYIYRYTNTLLTHTRV